MPKIILVANSKRIQCINHFLSPNDIIVRFNFPDKNSLALTGNRTDYLFVANTDDLASKKFKKNSKFMQFYHQFLKGSTIYFPYSDHLIKKIKPYYYKKKLIFFKKKLINWNNNNYITFLESENIRTKIMDDIFYWKAKQVIQSNNNDIISTGFLSYIYLSSLPEFENYEFILNGFTFEGWDGHNWNSEQNYIKELSLSGKIKLLTNS